MTTHRIPHIIKPSRFNHGDDPSKPSASIGGKAVLLINGMWHGIGGVPKGSFGRQVMEGPLVEGPWAYVYRMGTWISGEASSSMGAERERLEKAGRFFIVAEGDTVILAGPHYTVTHKGRGYYDLVPRLPERSLLVERALDDIKHSATHWSDKSFYEESDKYAEGMAEAFEQAQQVLTSLRDAITKLDMEDLDR